MELLNKLSNREQEVIKLLLEGKSNKQIASVLSISERTVEFHLKNIYEKFQVSSRIELVLKLGKAAGGAESEKLGASTVATASELVENGDRHSLMTNWATVLKQTVSSINKELKMTSSVSSEARLGGNSITFFESIRVCLTKYAEFNGRASRSEFWWFALFVTLVSLGCAYVSETLVSVFSVAMLLPVLAAGARRLHDCGKSGWWQLFLLVPVGGLMMLGFWWAQPPANSMPNETVSA